MIVFSSLFCILIPSRLLTQRQTFQMVHQVYPSYFPLWRHSRRMPIALQPFLYHSLCFFLPHLLQSKWGRVFLGVSWSCHWHIARAFLGCAWPLLPCFFLYASWLSLSDSWLDLIVSCTQWISILISLLCTSANIDVFSDFWIKFDSCGMCCFIPPPLLMILCDIHLSRYAFCISIKWFHMSFIFVAVLVFFCKFCRCEFSHFVVIPSIDSAIRPGLPCGQGWRIFFSRG